MTSMKGFTRLPSKWIKEGELSLLGTETGVPDLKVLMALAILSGESGRTASRRPSLGRSQQSDRATAVDVREAGQRELEPFAATINRLCDEAHMGRQAVVDSLRRLVENGRVERVSIDPRGLGSARRAGVYRFVGPPRPFLPFPWQIVRRQRLLANLRERTPPALAALKLLLLLAAFRDNGSGLTSIGYNKIEGYGITRRNVPAGLTILAAHHLVTRERASEEFRDDNPGVGVRYRVMGLSVND